MIARLFYLPAVISLAFLATSCSSGGLNTLVLTEHNLRATSPQNKRNVLADVIAGTRALTDVSLANPQCDFIAPRDAQAPQLQLRGNPGDPGFNFSVRWTPLNNTPSSSSCNSNDSITGISIESDSGIGLNQLTKSGTVSAFFGSTTFTSRYVEITMTRVDAGSNTLSANVQAWLENQNDPNDLHVLVITNGSFAKVH